MSKLTFNKRKWRTRLLAGNHGRSGQLAHRGGRPSGLTYGVETEFHDFAVRVLQWRTGLSLAALEGDPRKDGRGDNADALAWMVEVAFERRDTGKNEMGTWTTSRDATLDAAVKRVTASHFNSERR